MTPRLVSRASILRFFNSSMRARFFSSLNPLLIDGFLLLGLLVFLSLQLIADQCAGSQTQHATDGRADPGGRRPRR